MVDTPDVVQMRPKAAEWISASAGSSRAPAQSPPISPATDREPLAPPSPSVDSAPQTTVGHPATAAAEPDGQRVTPQVPHRRARQC